MKEYIVRYENEVLQLLPDRMQELVRCCDCEYSRKHHRDDVFGKPLYVCQRASLDNDELLHGDWFCAGGVKKDE